MSSTISVEEMRKLHERWRGMIRRCEDSHHRCYRTYGGRGISVCKEWHSFEVFVKWFFDDARTSPGFFNAHDRLSLSVDRIDNYGDYRPSNCRLSTQREQCNNMRKTRFIEFRGKLRPIREFCSEVGVNFHTFYSAFICGRADIKGRRIRVVAVDAARLNAFIKKHSKRGGAL